MASQDVAPNRIRRFNDADYDRLVEGSGPISRFAKKLVYKAIVKRGSQALERIDQTQRPGANIETRESHKYEPIDSSNREIRLLRILPPPRLRLKGGEAAQVIRCEMSRVPLRDGPKYTALSYTWGPLSKVPIWVNGEVLHVTENLLIALRWLREHSQPSRFLWIDAVCINQKDLDEKSAQVGMMGQIYKSASEVLVWLGPAHEAQLKTIIAIGTAAEAAGVWTVEKETFTERHRPIRELMDDLKANWIPGQPKKYPHNVNGFNPERIFLGVLQSAWFTRTWVLQEVALGAKATLCSGCTTTPFEVLITALKLLDLWLTWKPSDLSSTAATLKFRQATRERNKTVMDEALKNMRFVFVQPPSVTFRRFFNEDRGPFTLFQCLYITFVMSGPEMEIHATDPRDRIYSLLDISNDAADVLHIKPNYHKTVHKVFTELARALLRIGHWQILQLCRGRRLTGLPSWVPDWTAPVVGPWNMHPNFQASGPWFGQGLQMSPCSLDAPQLVLEAVNVGVVEKRGTTWSGVPRQYVNSGSIEATKLRFIEVESFLRESSIYRDEDISEPLWRIPISNYETETQSGARIASDFSRRGHESVRAMINRYFASLPLPPSKSPYDLQLWGVEAANGGNRPGEDDWSPYHQRMRALVDSCPVLLSNGLVGLGPSSCEVGDMVVIPLGSPVPFVVRPDKNGGYRDYHLIGEAYVHNIMNGEFLESGWVKPATFVFV